MAIDAGDKGTKININKPLPTPLTDGKAVRIEAEEKNKANEVSAEVTASLSPSGKIGGKRTQGSKNTSSRQTTECDTRTTASQRLGLAWWGFAIRDSHNQAGCFFPNKLLPDTEFEFSSRRPIPSQMQVEVASYWFSPPRVSSKEGRNSLRKFLWPRKEETKRRKEETKQPLPYYNFCHAVKLIIPPNMACNTEHIEEIDFNITEVAGDGTPKIKRGETEYEEGEPLVHMVTPAKDKYVSFDKETEGECSFSNWTKYLCYVQRIFWLKAYLATLKGSGLKFPIHLASAPPI